MSFLSRFRRKGLQQPVGNGLGWRSLISEPFTGAWQRNREITSGEVRSFFAIYSCITLIAGDISKLRARVMALGGDGVLMERPTPAALARPNRYQNHIQFKQWWKTSKLSQGNAYGLKQRDASGKVEAVYILDPSRVRPLVADDGTVFYELSADALNGVTEGTITVPASEIIHDRYQPQHHPLIGVSPIAAAALSGRLGLRIQQDSQTFFANGAKPGGILTAPGSISEDRAKELQEFWNKNFTGENSGRVAVAGDGLKFEPMRATSLDAQLVEQLKLSAEVVCSCFHVPPFKIGFGALPSGKVEEMNLIYYSDCLQVLIEEFEQCMTDGLGLAGGHSVELDIDSLWRMDSESKYRMLSEAIKGVMAPNEARRRVNLKPVEGGDSVYLQQQNFSLEALAKRDAKDDPFDRAPPAVNLDQVTASYERRFSDLSIDWERQARDVFEKMLEQVPEPRDAIPLESFDLAMSDDGRTLTVKMQAGDTVMEKQIKIPATIDRGVYVRDKAYEKGDGVTYGGCYWISQKDLPEGAPGSSDDWRMAVKKGRDGKDLRDNAATIDTSKGVSTK